jgi:hypothetical protein
MNNTRSNRKSKEEGKEVSCLDHTLPTNTVYSHLTYGALGLATEERRDENRNIECRRICEIKSSEYMN